MLGNPHPHRQCPAPADLRANSCANQVCQAHRIWGCAPPASPTKALPGSLFLMPALESPSPLTPFCALLELGSCLGTGKRPRHRQACPIQMTGLLAHAFLSNEPIEPPPLLPYPQHTSTFCAARKGVPPTNWPETSRGTSLASLLPGPGFTSPSRSVVLNLGLGPTSGS